MKRLLALLGCVCLATVLIFGTTGCPDKKKEDKKTEMKKADAKKDDAKKDDAKKDDAKKDAKKDEKKDAKKNDEKKAASLSSDVMNLYALLSDRFLTPVYAIRSLEVPVADYRARRTGPYVTA